MNGVEFGLNTFVPLNGEQVTLKMALDHWINERPDSELNEEDLYPGIQAKKKRLEVEVEPRAAAGRDRFFTYKCSKTNTIDNLKNAISLEMFAKAKLMHKEFVTNRIKDEQVPLSMRLYYRREEDKCYDADEQPFLTKINQCIHFIERVQEDRVAHQGDKKLSELEKYRRAVDFINMAKNPTKV